jgi:hypothetical protein
MLRDRTVSESGLGTAENAVQPVDAATDGDDDEPRQQYEQCADGRAAHVLPGTERQPSAVTMRCTASRASGSLVWKLVTRRTTSSPIS